LNFNGYRPPGAIPGGGVPALVKAFEVWYRTPDFAGAAKGARVHHFKGPLAAPG